MENKPTNQSAQIQEAKLQEFKDIVAKKYGFTDWSDFKESAPTWKQVDEYYIEAFTLAMYKATASSGERVDGWHPRYKHDDDERFVFQIDTGENRGKWFYAYRDGDGKNQHSKVFKTKAEAVKEYNLLPLFTTSPLSHPSTKQSVNPPAQEVDVEKLINEHKLISTKDGYEYRKDGQLMYVSDVIKIIQALQSEAGGFSLEDVVWALEKGYLQATIDYLEGKKGGTMEECKNKFIQSLTSALLQTKGREVEYQRYVEEQKFKGLNFYSMQDWIRNNH